MGSQSCMTCSAISPDHVDSKRNGFNHNLFTHETFNGVLIQWEFDGSYKLMDGHMASLCP